MEVRDRRQRQTVDPETNQADQFSNHSAEEVGFEPTDELPRRRFSKPVLSSTQAPLRTSRDPLTGIASLTLYHQNLNPPTLPEHLRPHKLERSPSQLTQSRRWGGCPLQGSRRYG